MSGLRSKRVVVTRALHQAEELARPLRERGAAVILLPMIEIATPADTGPLRRAAREINDYDWLIFSSTNAVAALVEYIGPGQESPRARIAVIGAATRDAVEALGWKVDVVPEQFVAESLVDALSPGALHEKRVLFPSAAVTREIIPRALRERGARVDVVEAYRNIMPENSAAEARTIFSESPLPDWVTFTSSSCVDNLVSAVGTQALSKIRIASIGPVTSATIRRHGLAVHAEPEEHTIPALVEALDDGDRPKAD
jgi:uroporphyrinogen-III synthase